MARIDHYYAPDAPKANSLVAGGELATSDESTEVRYFAPAELEALQLHPAQRLRIQHALERGRQPYFS
jgi:hypothetical protein